MRSGRNPYGRWRFLLTTAIPALLFTLVLMAASLKVVREGERLVVFRLGRVMSAGGPGLVQVIPIVDRAVRVHVPVHLVRVMEGSPYARGGAATNVNEELRGHRGITVGEVAVRAAMIAVQRDPRTKRATAEDFLAALEGMKGGRGSGAW